ncbi:MAG: carboxypeptidase regulatory-like domain-containing protein [Pirellulaceae bacterium]|nr:carboxypeptidase regulatory-like domain-containing protein [Pirellulaceae bacterium]
MNTIGSAQEAERDPAQATVSLRGIVTDEQGTAIVGATVEAMRYDGAVTSQTKSIEGGAFLLRLPLDSYQGNSLLIFDQSRRLASIVSGSAYNVAEAKNVIRAVLKPLRKTTVTVVDRTGKPLADASVRMYAEYGKLLESPSNAMGQAMFEFPADAKVDWIVAFKAGHGFDYYENYDSFPTQIRLDVPTEVNLKLDGFTSVKVKVLDTKNRPVADVAVTPWIIKKAGKVSYANLSADQLGKTDANGIATFDWIPTDLERGITFSISDQRFHCPAAPYFLPNTPNTDLEAIVWKLCTVRGKVLHEDGTPAAGIRLQGEGRGATNDYYRGHTSTKSDGTFELQIYPDQDTIIAITDEKFAAASATGIKLKEEAVLENVDFHLSRGFLVAGSLTQGPKNSPAAKQTATLIQQGPNGSQLVRWSESDKNGKYRFRVGPGDYQLRLLDDKMLSITVKDKDLEFDAHIDRLPRGTLSGKVTDSAGKPLKAEIYGESIGAAGHAGLVFKSTEDGTFVTERWNDKMQLLAIDVVNRLAIVVNIEAETETLALELEPAASISGIVKDENGKPLKNVAVNASSNAVRRIQLTTQTDEAGKFSFPALPPEMNWRVTMSTAGDSQSKEVDIQEAKEYQLEDFVTK